MYIRSGNIIVHVNKQNTGQLPTEINMKKIQKKVKNNNNNNKNNQNNDM